MLSYKERMRRAGECVRLAGMTDDTIVRDQVLELAGGWLRTPSSAQNNNARAIEFPRSATRPEGSAMSGGFYLTDEGLY